ncbi:MAG: alpha/beta hydrolase family protein [Dehalococcoidia bacterium]
MWWRSTSGLLRVCGLALAMLMMACSNAPKQMLDPSTPIVGIPAQITWQATDPSFTALPGARALYGKLGAAVYEVEVPDTWNGELVLYAHGFAGTEPFLIVSPPPLRSRFIAEGFAWAASSFSVNGYDPQVDVDDTLALLEHFKQSVREPKRVYIDGTSMGGHVVVASLEQHPDVFSGALSECGVVAGVEEMDYLVSYEAVGQYLAGLELLPVTDIDKYVAAVRRTLIPALQAPVSRTLTDKGEAFESVMSSYTGGSRPFRHEGFLDRFSGNFTQGFYDLGRKTLGARAGTNVGANYQIAPGFGISDSGLNAGVYRLPADPAVRNAATNPAFAPMTGRINAPLLTLHTTGDAFVPFRLEQDYRRIVESAGRGDLLVQRAIRRPDHCQFMPAELTQAWDDLVKWVEHGIKPDGDNVLSTDLSQAGLKWTLPLLPTDPGGL